MVGAAVAVGCAAGLRGSGARLLRGAGRVRPGGRDGRLGAAATGCGSMSVNGINYMNCAGVFYMPFYSGGALMYQVTTP